MCAVPPVKSCLAIALGLSALLAPRIAGAGGGPENVLIVVNANSEASKTVANNYVNWRQIPGGNVVFIDWKGTSDGIGAIQFREKILLPILTVLDERHLAPQIDYIIYSCDFPWKIELRELAPDHKFPPELWPTASLNGATYLAPLLLAQSPAIVNPDINWFVPSLNTANLAQCQDLAAVSTRGFRSRYLWNKSGKKTEAATDGQRYLMSTVLGFTTGRGNTVDEILGYLRRSVLADGTKPKGTIYFMWNKDVRSATRDKCFPDVAAQIKAAGVNASVQQGRVPPGAKDVAGLVVVAADFSLTQDGVKILPGAICEHLTSEGGVMNNPNSKQSPLSDFLRAGAAGASGTVVEPRAIQAKFPLPSVQLHYVRGCSLAEAFYQSVSGPYQLLIVGDALCQPWANIPKVALTGVKKDERVKGKLTLTPSSLAPMSQYELFVDGRLIARSTKAEPVTLDTTKFADGYHEIRVVGSRADPIETQGRAIVPIIVDNHGAAVEIKVAPATRAPISGKFKVTVRQPGATSIAVRQNSRDLGRVMGETGELEIPATAVGRGPTTIQAFGLGKAPAVSPPVHLFVE